MRDFTLDIYAELVNALKESGYKFITYSDYCKGHKDGKFVILRHDVDLKAYNSLATALLEQKIGAVATYYFRVVPQSCVPEAIKGIAAAGHEIGYHYEDMTICDGDTEKAIAHFREKLAFFRQFYPVETICMHGSPRSDYDAKDLWKNYDYRKEGIIGEPYFDTDFSQLFYLTDTGRRWDGYKVSVRDKVPRYQDEWTAQGLVFHATSDIINAVKAGSLPAQLMITTHPQRWTNKMLPWIQEFVLQNAKNVVKAFIVARKQTL